MKKKIFIISSTILVLVTIMIIFGLINYNYNKQLNINSFTSLYIYKFQETEGKGFIENKVSYNQKRAIWNLIDHMSPCEKIEFKDEIVRLGGYSAFCFIKNDFKLVFNLKDLKNDMVYIGVTKFDMNYNIIDTYYFTAAFHYAEKIKGVIIYN